MNYLRIDIETYSSVDLIKCGVYKYADSDDFEVLLFGYAFDDEPVRLIDLLDMEEIPEEVEQALFNPEIIKTAYNANFERTCLAKHFGKVMPPEQWRCTAVQASHLALPSSLDGVAKTLGLSAQKDAAGKNLIKYFSIPCKPTKVNGGRTRNYPEHAPERWEKYKSYCMQDVEVEREISKKLHNYPLPDDEQKLWVLDQRINDKGVKVDVEMIQHAITCDELVKAELLARACELTGLNNPNSNVKLKNWITEIEGFEVDSVAKAEIPTLIDKAEHEVTKEVLQLKQQLSKTSVKKYEAMQRMVCSDSHVRGILQFYGANRTGRWAGRGVQVHNLPRNYLRDLDEARETLKNGDYDLLDVLYDNVADTLSQLVRTTFIAEDGQTFNVADFSAIEARVVAWVAEEKWRLKVFNTHGKIYEASAAKMFKVPIESIGKGSDLRQRGKVAELALGYQGGPGALVQMGALDMGIEESELRGLVDSWRDSNPNIKQFWYDVQNAAIRAVKTKTTVRIQKDISFIPTSNFLFIQLPSGRRLSYYSPRIEDGDFGDQLTYEGIGENKKWCRLKTYGGKLVENIVQAIARDCLAVSMIRLDDAGYDIRMHVHDEVIISHPVDEDSLEDITNIMGQEIEWVKGLPLGADGYYTKFYKKD